LLDARCLISVPGQAFEVPALFVAWMFGELENEITEELQNKAQGILGSKAGSCGEKRSHCSHQTKKNDDVSNRSHWSF
jgi:hypothetical protein